MDAWALPLALVTLSVICVVMGLFGADSRPGFAGARSSYKERWFPHSKNDLRFGLVEAAGVEPASEAASPGISTSVSGNLILLGGSSRRDPLLPAAVTVLPQGRGAPAVAIRSM